MKLLSLIPLLLIIFLIFVAYRVYTTQHGTQQAEFLAGKLPAEMPDGLYKGSSEFGANNPWKGKKFDRAAQTGINEVTISGRTAEKFPFKTYTGVGIVDTQLQVIKIDYDIPQNPWFVKIVLDEIVQTAPGHFLGKVNLRVAGLVLPVGYFGLGK